MDYLKMTMDLLKKLNNEQLKYVYYFIRSMLD